MKKRNTTTGAILEAMIVPALERRGYELTTQVTVGNRPGGGVHRVDAIAKNGSQTTLVSLKWQQISGATEQKVPSEMMCLSDATRDGHGDCAYLVLGGDGRTLRDYYTSGAIAEHLIHAKLVNVVTWIHLSDLPTIDICRTNLTASGSVKIHRGDSTPNRD